MGPYKSYLRPVHVGFCQIVASSNHVIVSTMQGIKGLKRAEKCQDERN